MSNSNIWNIVPKVLQTLMRWLALCSTKCNISYCLQMCNHLWYFTSWIWRFLWFATTVFYPIRNLLFYLFVNFKKAFIEHQATKFHYTASFYIQLKPLEYPLSRPKDTKDMVSHVLHHPYLRRTCQMPMETYL